MEDTHTSMRKRSYETVSNSTDGYIQTQRIQKAKKKVTELHGKKSGVLDHKPNNESESNEPN